MERSRLVVVALGCVALGALGAVAIGEVFDDDAPEVQVVTVPDSAPAPTTEAPAPTTSISSAPSSVDPAPATGEQMISSARAGEIGAEAAGGRTIDVHPGFEGGRSVFYVDVRTSDGLVEVYVDAMTGDVVKVQQGS